MVAFGAVLPILLLLFFVAFFYLFAIRQWKRMKKPAKKPGNKLVTGYTVVLVVGLLVFIFLHVDDGDKEKVDIVNIPDLYQAAEKGELAQAAKDYVAQKWEFPYTENVIKIQKGLKDLTAHVDYDEADVDEEYIDGDREDGSEYNVNDIPISLGFTDSRHVLITYYKTPAIFNQGLDVTKYVNDPSVKLVKNKLIVQMPQEAMLEYNAYKQEFPMMQFAKNRKPIDDWMEHENNSFYHVSQQYLYVQIPRGVKIDADEDLWIE